MPTSPGAAPGYRPRAATNPLQELVEENLEALFRDWDARFREEHGPLHPRLSAGTAPNPSRSFLPR